MNGKFVLMLMICFNIVGLLVTAGYQDINPDSEVGFGNNYIMNMFFSPISSSDLDAEQGIGFNNQTEDAVASASQGQEGGIVESTVNFILAGWDVVKMVGGFLLILTPFPILAFFSSLSLPLWILIVIGMPIALIYFISIMEFVRGGSF
jgi:hypothetical protein